MKILIDIDSVYKCILFTTNRKLISVMVDYMLGLVQININTTVYMF